MYVEGTTDLMGMIMQLPLQSAEMREKNLALIIERSKTRYFPVYEKVSDKSARVHIAASPYTLKAGCDTSPGSVWWKLHSGMGKEGHEIILG